MKKIFLFIASTLIVLGVQAREVSQKAALRCAKEIMPNRANSLKLVEKAKGDNPAWYAFSTDSENGGYVIVSGDDCARQVLGYSDEGSFDLDNMPDDMRWWLQGCEEQITMIRKNGQRYNGVSVEGRKAVAPLLTTKWGQDSPYNLQTPIIDGSHASTGCMATAMAQILNYWKSDAGADEIAAYTTKTEQISLDVLPATTFKYQIIKDEYDSDDEDESAYEVAKLMRYCGQAFQVDYGKLESGANGGSELFVNGFHFDKHACDIKRIQESREEFDSIIYNEVSNGRPVFVSGISYKKGHGFVVDGYNGEGLYHINWGWNGSNNGYFLLDVACSEAPDDNITQGEGYSIGIVASICLQPESDKISEDDFALTISSMEVDKETITRSSVNEDFSLSISGQANNNYGTTLDFELAAGVFTVDGVFLKTGRVISQSLKSLYGASWTRRISFGSGIESGTYIIKPVSRLAGQETWNPEFHSNLHYVKMTIDGNTMTLQAVTHVFTKDFTINGLEVVGTAKVGKETTLCVNATNTGTYFVNALYVFINNRLESAIGVPFNPGETGVFYLHFTPSVSGKQTIQIRTSRNSSNTTIYTTTIDVDAPSEPSLEIDGFKIANLVEGTQNLNKPEWRITLNVKNLAVDDFEGSLLTYLYKKNMDTGSYSYIRSVETDVNLQAGQVTPVEILFDDIDIDAYYLSRTLVFKPSENKYITLYQSSGYYTLDMSTGVDCLDIERKFESDSEYYRIDGARITEPEGLCIERKSDGTVRKVYIEK